MYDFETNNEIIEMIEKCVDSDKMVEVLHYIKNECEKRNLLITDYRWKSLVNHISAMIVRAAETEELGGIDETMFTDIGKDSIGIADNIVEMIGNLSVSEKFLLSVHFEVAKNTK